MGFIDPPYMTTEAEGATAVFRVGIISSATILPQDTSISLSFSTTDGTEPGIVHLFKHSFIHVYNIYIYTYRFNICQRYINMNL